MFLPFLPHISTYQFLVLPIHVPKYNETKPVIVCKIVFLVLKIKAIKNQHNRVGIFFIKEVKQFSTKVSNISCITMHGKTMQILALDTEVCIVTFLYLFNYTKIKNPCRKNLQRNSFSP